MRLQGPPSLWLTPDQPRAPKWWRQSANILAEMFLSTTELRRQTNPAELV
jgi:hypothetical protein